MSRHVTLFAIVAALATIPACASAPAAGTPANTTSANVDILTADEIADRNLGDRSLLDIIRLVRSQYLNFHGKSGTTASAGRVQVSFGTQSLSSVDDLANVIGRDVLDVRYLSASSAAQRFGSSANNGPVIVVRHK